MRVPTGSIYALLGPNGAGKTTTLKALMNLRPPASGVARVLGVDSPRARPGRPRPHRLCVREPADPLEPDDRRDRGVLPAVVSDVGRRARHRAARALRSRSTRPHQVAVARHAPQVQCLLALAPRPRLLILDEPFSGLDPVVRDDLTTGILSLADRDGWSVLLTSHEMDDVERLADHVGFLANGALLVEEPMRRCSRASGGSRSRSPMAPSCRLSDRRPGLASRSTVAPPASSTRRRRRCRGRRGAPPSPARRSRAARCRCATCSSPLRARAGARSHR